MELPEITPFFGYLPKPSLVDFPGYIAAVFFTSGCNFACGFCHNAPLLGSRKQGFAMSRFTALLQEFQDTDWITGVTISGGEPTLSPDLPAFIRWIRNRGLAVKLDTNGSKPELLEAVIDELDYIAMDIKCSLPQYRDFVGFGDTDAISRSIRIIRDRARDYEFRTTVVESVHTPEEIMAVGKLIEGARRYILQPFLPRDDLPSREYRTMRRTPPDLLTSLRIAAAPFCKEVSCKGTA